MYVNLRAADFAKYSDSDCNLKNINFAWKVIKFWWVSSANSFYKKLLNKFNVEMNILL